MNLDIGLLIGLLAIAISIFLGLLFGLSGFRKGITDELSTIKESVVAIRTTVDKTWDLIMTRFGLVSGTVERELENLGKIKITAEPSFTTTTYIVEISRPILKEGLLYRMFKQKHFVEVETQLLGQEGTFYVLSPIKIRYVLNSTDPKACTKFITFMLKELNDYYPTLQVGTKDFEEPILS